MLRRNAMNSKVLGELCRLPPGQLAAGIDPPPAKPPRKPFGHPILNLVPKRADGGPVQMVVMRVADQHMIDRWQILEANSRRGHAAQAIHGNRLNVSKNGVGEYVEALML